MAFHGRFFPECMEDSNSNYAYVNAKTMITRRITAWSRPSLLRNVYKGEECPQCSFNKGYSIYGAEGLERIVEVFEPNVFGCLDVSLMMANGRKRLFWTFWWFFPSLLALYIEYPDEECCSIYVLTNLSPNHVVWFPNSPPPHVSLFCLLLLMHRKWKALRTNVVPKKERKRTHTCNTCRSK